MEHLYTRIRSSFIRFGLIKRLLLIIYPRKIQRIKSQKLQPVVIWTLIIIVQLYNPAVDYISFI